MRSCRTRISLTAPFCISMALMLLLLPLKWLLAAVFAAAVHEGFHYIALLLCSCRPRVLRIGATGAAMETGDLPPGKALFCALAGPIGALSLLAFAKYLPRTAICVCIHSGFNLLPLFPLDGGRALLNFGLRFCPKHAKSITRAVGIGVIALLALVLWQLGMGFICVVLMVTLLGKKALAMRRSTGYNSRE